MNQVKNNKEKQKSPVVRAAMFSGPIPPPNVLADYEKLKAGLADRIVTMAEKQSEHRIAIETKNMEAQVNHLTRRDSEAKRGQWMAFGISIFAIVMGALVASRGHPFTGGGITLIGLSPIVAAFIYGRKKDK